MKPFIGITCNYDTSDEVGRATALGSAGQDWNYVAGDYAYAIERAGGVPVLLPRTLDPEPLHLLIDRLDGVLISGGHDIDPSLYGERIKGVCGRIVPERDVYDLEVTRYAYRTGKPILAICRGTQILNVAFGGTIYQDLEQNGFEHHFMSNSPRECPVHQNTLEEGSILHSVFGSTVRVNSFYHQAVHDPGDGVTITARSEEGVPEGIEVTGGNSFVVGVQWHPEMMFTSEEQQKLFQALITACRT